MSQFMDTMKKRRSIYGLEASSPITDDALSSLISDAVKHVPSAFNMQSAKAVLLLGNQHKKFWNIVLETLRGIVPAENFAPTEEKNASFASGYGTVLFFQDTAIVEDFSKQYPDYAENFPLWANQGDGMLQHSVWCLLTEAGLGASLQHYNPIVDDATHKEWDIPKNYKLIAQMPFGKTTQPPDEKQFNDMNSRFYRFD